VPGTSHAKENKQWASNNEDGSREVVSRPLGLIAWYQIWSDAASVKIPQAAQ
jgi:hypothetical protein